VTKAVCWSFNDLEKPPVSSGTLTISFSTHTQTHKPMLKRILLFSSAVACALLLTNCGTIMQGARQEVSVSSSPTSARILIDGQPMGQTPVTLDLKRKDKHTVRLELDGYQPYEMAMRRSVSYWVAGNIIFGGLIGLAVDAISGGMYKLSPEQITAELAAGTSAVMRDEELFITVVLVPNPEWEQIGQLTPQP
jgi:predicted small secreted protein